MNLLRANCELLQQGIQLLSRHDERTFIATDPASYGSGIGAHFRHVLDHYRSFLDGLAGAYIDYDNRIRNTEEETNLEVAMGSLGAIFKRIEEANVSLDGIVKVKVRAAEEGEPLLTTSSLGRELQFLVSHTVHHYALIAIASRMQGIYPNESFGVAPSTLNYMNSAKA